MYGHMLNQTIELDTVTGTNDYGEDEHAGTQTHRARVEFVNKSKMTEGGNVIPIACKVWLKVDVAINAGDKLMFEGNNYRVITHTKIPDGTGRYRMNMVECAEWR